VLVSEAPEAPHVPANPPPPYKRTHHEPLKHTCASGMLSSASSSSHSLKLMVPLPSTSANCSSVCAPGRSGSVGVWRSPARARQGQGGEQAAVSRRRHR
jgi:hypothetical protein